MIAWNDIAEGKLPEIGKPVLIYPDWEFGELDEMAHSVSAQTWDIMSKWLTVLKNRKALYINQM